jgi:hypothetical protein
MSPVPVSASLSAARASLAGLKLPPWCDPARLVVCLHLDTPSPSNNVIKGLHFHRYKKLRNDFALSLSAALGDHEPRAVPQSALYIVRRCAGSMDWDNAIGGMKPILDCMVASSTRNPSGLGIIEDDKPKNMPYPPMMKQLPAKRNAGSTDIYVFEVDPE